MISKSYRLAPASLAERVCAWGGSVKRPSVGPEFSVAEGQAQGLGGVTRKRLKREVGMRSGKACLVPQVTVRSPHRGAVCMGWGDETGPLYPHPNTGHTFVQTLVCMGTH